MPPPRPECELSPQHRAEFIPAPGPNLWSQALVGARERSFLTLCCAVCVFFPPPLPSVLLSDLLSPQCCGRLKDSFWWKTPRSPPSTGTQECSGLYYSAGTFTCTLSHVTLSFNVAGSFDSFHTHKYYVIEMSF